MTHPAQTAHDAGTLAWWKSSYSSEQGACVEVAHAPQGRMAVRDSKMHTGPHLVIDTHAFTALVAGLVTGTV
ncbi:hypothetical protein GCM10010339_87230 [Streptomyces alanosinicus]|uniref:DUF397 domain-containing protein n=2 Tax=Streptomyces alanosinicus TaxID=68171 RepID=A0A918YTN5_9ACTN|nr:hypothetical protein GCM10010339_87230 [Streptomyces alanosinicus]